MVIGIVIIYGRMRRNRIVGVRLIRMCIMVSVLNVGILESMIKSISINLMITNLSTRSENKENISFTILSKQP